jgi:hypothetical protein
MGMYNAERSVDFDVVVESAVTGAVDSPTWSFTGSESRREHSTNGSDELYDKIVSVDDGTGGCSSPYSSNTVRMSYGLHPARIPLFKATNPLASVHGGHTRRARSHTSSPPPQLPSSVVPRDETAATAAPVCFTRVASQRVSKKRVTHFLQEISTFLSCRGGRVRGGRGSIRAL